MQKPTCAKHVDTTDIFKTDSARQFLQHRAVYGLSQLLYFMARMLQPPAAAAITPASVKGTLREGAINGRLAPEGARIRLKSPHHRFTLFEDLLGGPFCMPSQRLRNSGKREQCCKSCPTYLSDIFMDLCLKSKRVQIVERIERKRKFPLIFLLKPRLLPHGRTCNQAHTRVDARGATERPTFVLRVQLIERQNRNTAMHQCVCLN